LHGYNRLCMDTTGFAWIQPTLHGYNRLCMDATDFAWMQPTLHGCNRLCTDATDFAQMQREERCVENLITNAINKLVSNSSVTKAKGIGTTYDPRKIVGEIVLLGISFYSLPWPTLAAVMTTGFGALRLRDQWIHPAKGTLDEAATDALVMASAIMSMQAYFLVNSPAFAAVNLIGLLRGSGLAMILVTPWRLFFHALTPSNDPLQRGEFVVFSAAVRVNIMSSAAVLLIMMSNVEAVPGGHLRDQLNEFTMVLAAGFFLATLKTTDKYTFFPTEITTL
jgi:hypothetical protein